MSSQVSERGQITIDREVRKQLGIRPGMIAVQRIVEGALQVVFIPAPHRRSLFGALQTPAMGPGPRSSREIEEAVQEAMAEEQARREHAHE